MRLRGAKTELADAGLETDGMADSIATLRQEVMALSGVDIMENDTTFKSTYDILDELANVWSNLNDIQQASVTELIAGKRQGNIVSALMSNFDIAREALNTALSESEGSAERELQNWNKGIEASISHFQAQFQGFSTTAINSDFLKGLVDFGTGGLEVLTQIIDKFGILNGLIAGLSVYQGVKGNGLGSSLLQSLFGFGTFESLFDYPDDFDKFFNGIKKGKSYNDALQGLRIPAEYASDLHQYVDATDKAKLSTKDFQKTLEANGKSISSSSKGVTSLASGFSKFGKIMGGIAINLGVNFAIQKGIEAVVNSWNDYAQAQERAIGLGQESLESYNAKQKEFASGAKLIESSGKRFVELQKGVSNGINVGLTTDEFKEYNNLANQIAESFPSLVSGYTSLGDPIIAVTSNVNDLNDALEKQKSAFAMSQLASAQIYEDAFNAQVNQLKTGNNVEMGLKQRQEILDRMVEQNNEFIASGGGDFTVERTRPIWDEYGRKVLEYKTFEESAGKLKSYDFRDETDNRSLSMLGGMLGDYHNWRASLEENHPIMDKVMSFLESATGMSSLDFKDLDLKAAKDNLTNLDLGTRQLLEEAGADFDYLDQLYDDIEKYNRKGDISKRDKAVDAYNESWEQINQNLANMREENKQQLDASLDMMKPFIDSVFQGGENSGFYSNLKEGTKNAISGIVDAMGFQEAFNSGFFDEAGDIDTSKIADWGNALVRDIKRSNAEDSLNELFNMQQNRGQIGYQEYLEKTSGLIDAVTKKVPSMSKSMLESATGIDEYSNNLNEMRLDLLNSGVNEGFLNSLSNADLELVWNLNADGLITSADMAIAKMEEAKRVAEENKYFDEYQTALQSENAGSKYDTMTSGLQAAIDAYNKGLTGTDDFKTYAALLSPTGSDDPRNFMENLPKAQRYLTEGREGVDNFLADLSSLTTSTGEAVASIGEDGNWKFNVGDLDAIAQNLGIGTEFVGAMFNKLRDYGIDSNVVTDIQDGASRTGSLISKLESETRNLNKLESEALEGTEGYSTDAGDRTFGNQTAIDESRKKIQQYNDDIVETSNNTRELIRTQNDSAESQRKSAIAAVKALNEQKKIAEEKGLVDTANAIQSEMDKYGKEFGFNVDAEINFDLESAYTNVNSIIDSIKLLNGQGADTTTQMSYLASEIQNIAAHDGDISGLVMQFNTLAQLSKSDFRLDEFGQQFSVSQVTSEMQSLASSIDRIVSNGGNAEEGMARLAAGIQQLSFAGVDTSSLVGMYNYLAELSGSEFRMLITGELVNKEELTNPPDAQQNVNQTANPDSTVTNPTDANQNVNQTANPDSTVTNPTDTEQNVNQTANPDPNVTNPPPAEQEVNQTVNPDSTVTAPIKVPVIPDVSGLGTGDNFGQLFGGLVKPEKVPVQAKVDGVDTSALDGLDGKEVDVSVNLTGVTDVETFSSSLETLADKDISINIAGNSKTELSSITTALSTLSAKNISINIKVSGKADVESVKNAIQTISGKNVIVNVQVPQVTQVEALKSSIAAITGKSVVISVLAIGIDAVNALKAAIDMLQPKTVEVIANVYGTDSVNALTAAIDAVYSKTVNVGANVNTSSTAQIWGMVNAINSLHSKTVNVTTNYTTTGSPPNSGMNWRPGAAAGTMLSPARSSGTAYNVLNMIPAYANGKVSLDKDEKALVNEVGQESIVRDGKWFLIPGGVHTENLKKGDIVFSASQTEDLLKRGKAIGHGKAYADGTASNLKPISNAYASGSDDSITKVSDGLQDILDHFENFFDFIERGIEKWSKRIDYFITRMENSVTMAAQTAYANKAIGSVRRTKSRYEEALAKYQETADSVASKVGLSTELKTKVQDGSIEVTELTADEKAKVEAYAEWYDKIMECKQAIADLINQEKELLYDRVDIVVDHYDALIEKYDKRAGRYGSKISWMEATGQTRAYVKEENRGKDTAYIDTLQLQRTQIGAQFKLQEIELKKYNDRIKQIEKQENFNKADSEYQKLLAKKAEMESALYENKEAYHELTQAIREARYSVFEVAIDGLKRVADRMQAAMDYFMEVGSGITEHKYNNQIGNINNQIIAKNDLIEAKKQELVTYEYNSAEYQRVRAEISELNNEIIELATNAEKIKKEIRELRWEPFYENSDKLNNMVSDIEHMQQLLGDENFLNEDGTFTGDAISNMLLIGKGIETHQKKIAEYREGLKRLEEELANGNITQKQYNEESAEFIGIIQDSAMAIEDYKDQYLDMYIDKQKKLNEILQENIDLRSDALDEMKGYYEYDRNLRKQTRDIDNLKAQIAALEGVNNLLLILFNCGNIPIIPVRYNIAGNGKCECGVSF